MVKSVIVVGGGVMGLSTALQVSFGYIDVVFVVLGGGGVMCLTVNSPPC